MSKVIPKTKEQLVYYLLSNISLGTYDKRFLSNIQTFNVVNKKPVTTNQHDLLNKVVLRYKRQLAKFGLDSTDIVELPWTIEPIESLPQYTEAHISIEDDRVVLRSPFKQEFVKEFRDYLHSTWNREERIWTCPLSEEILRHVISITMKHYDHVNLDETIKTIIDELSQYEDVKYWEPTLVESNGKLYIAATNSSLEQSIFDIELNTDPSTIARLAHYGVKIAIDLEKHNIPSFAIDRIVQIDYNAKDIINVIKTIDSDYVLMTEWFGIQKDFTQEVISELNNNNIEHKLLERRAEPDSLNLRNYKLPVILSSWSFVTNNALHSTAAKTIHLVNNNPIAIK